MSNECPKSFDGSIGSCEACGYSRARVLAEGCPKDGAPADGLLADLTSRVEAEQESLSAPELMRSIFQTAQPKVLIVCSEDGDWEGLYIDGELVKEGHTLTLSEVLEAIGVKYQTFSVAMDPYKFNHLPQKASDLPEPVE